MAQIYTIKNKMKEKLNAGKIAVGTGLMWPDPTAVESFGAMGFDFFRIEGEHGVASYQELSLLVKTAYLYDITPAARVPGNVEHEILHYLDAGIMSITVPHVKNKQDAEKAVYFAKHNPIGNRGDFYARAGYYGKNLSQREYYDAVNETTMVIALIEDYEGVEKCEEIMKTPGVDAIDIGPYDLSQSMGIPEWKHVQEAYERVIKTAVSLNMPVQLGTAGNYRDQETVRKYVEMGCRMFLFGGFFQHGVSECFKFVDELRNDYGI